MFTGNVVAFWKKTLDFFKPTNFRLFLLVSLKTWSKSIWLFFKYFGWFYLLNFFVVAKFYNAAPLCSFLYKIIYLFPFIFIIFFMLLIVRPSLELKNFDYFVRYAHRLGGVVAIISIASMFLFAIFEAWTYFFGNYLSFSYGSMIAVFYVLFVLPIITFCSFFFLDSNGSTYSLCSSFSRSVIAFIYHLPVCLILGLIGAGIFLIPVGTSMSLVHFLLGKSAGMMDFVRLALKPLAILFFFCFMANYYTKIKHSNYKLFFLK